MGSSESTPAPPPAPVISEEGIAKKAHELALKDEREWQQAVDAIHEDFSQSYLHGSVMPYAEIPITCRQNPATGRPFVRCLPLRQDKRSEGMLLLNKLFDRYLGPEMSETRIGLQNNMIRDYCISPDGATDPDCACILRREDPKYQKLLNSMPGIGGINNRCWWEPCWNEDLAIDDFRLPPCNSSTCSITYVMDDIGGNVVIKGDNTINGCGGFSQGMLGKDWERTTKRDAGSNETFEVFKPKNGAKETTPEKSSSRKDGPKLGRAGRRWRALHQRPMTMTSKAFLFMGTLVAISLLCSALSGNSAKKSRDAPLHTPMRKRRFRTRNGSLRSSSPRFGRGNRLPLFEKR
jgi:hypothetical protein